MTKEFAPNSVEEAFHAAISLSPSLFDLRFSLSSSKQLHARAHRMRRGLGRRRRRSLVVCGRANLSSVPIPSFDFPPSMFLWMGPGWLVRLVHHQLNLWK